MHRTMTVYIYIYTHTYNCIYIYLQRENERHREREREREKERQTDRGRVCLHPLVGYVGWAAVAAQCQSNTLEKKNQEPQRRKKQKEEYPKQEPRRPKKWEEEGSKKAEQKEVCRRQDPARQMHKPSPGLLVFAMGGQGSLGLGFF